jgi:hypothetical protein
MERTRFVSHVVSQNDQNQKPDLASITTSRRLDGLDGHDFWGSGRGGSVWFQGLRVFSKTKSRAYPFEPVIRPVLTPVEAP